MRKQYIKVPIPEAISEDGGASIVFVNKQTVPLDGAITEALAGNYCTGQKTLIRNFFFGLMQSMADGVRRDGHARQIANFLTVYPVFKGEIDLERGYDPEVNGVMIRARLLNEMDLDITDWSFEDVTEGKRSFRLDSVKAGPVIGEYLLGETGNLNGKDLPSTEAGETLRVHWAVEGTDKSGDIAAAKLSSDVSRIDIADDALDELKDAQYVGKTIVFTVRGNFSSAKISATVKYDPPVPIAESSDHEVKIFEVNPAGDAFCIGDDWTARGVKLGYDEDAQTGIRSAEVRFGEDQVMYLPIPTALPLETTEFELPTWGEVPEGVEPGEHDADLVFERVKSNVVTDRLTVPLKVTVRE